MIDDIDDRSHDSWNEVDSVAWNDREVGHYDIFVYDDPGHGETLRREAAHWFTDEPAPFFIDNFCPKPTVPAQRAQRHSAPRWPAIAVGW